MTASDNWRSVNDYGEDEALLVQALMDLDTNKEESSKVDDIDEITGLNGNWDWVLTNYDVGTTVPQSIDQEVKRLQVLKSYQLLDSEREVEFDRLTRMAARVFQVPICLVSLIDLGRQWFMSNHGLGDAKGTSRDVSFCAHAIQQKNYDVLVVKDATKDPRFCNMPAVTGDPHVRFYAGMPLLSPEGYALGTFCLVDTKPWPQGLTPDEKATLRDYAAMTVEAIVNRRKTKSSAISPQEMACTTHDLVTSMMGLQLNLSILQEDAASLTEVQRATLSQAIAGSEYLNRITGATTECLREIALQQDPRCSSRPMRMEHFVSSLKEALQCIPKMVPLILSVDESVPEEILCDDLKLLRSSMNLLSSAVARTQQGAIQFSVTGECDKQPDASCKPTKPQHVLFECIDSGVDLDIEDEAELFQTENKDPKLFSMARHITSLQGSYGYQPPGDGRSGSILWFRVPVSPLQAPDYSGQSCQVCVPEELQRSLDTHAYKQNRHPLRRNSPSSVADMPKRKDSEHQLPQQNRWRESSGSALETR